VPLFFIPILMTIGALSIAIAFIAPYVRDIGEFVHVSMNMLFWLTPVLYLSDILPAWAQHVVQWNPFFIMLHPIQMLAYANVMPGAADIMKLFALTLVSITIGFSVYRICRRNYVYYL